MIDHRDITGLVLAGGRGSRMGGIDKGLQLHRGKPLAALTLERLAPQVGGVIVSANRNLAVYESWGVTVVADRSQGHVGPLAGILAGLQQCPTTWLATVPCDCPAFPHDLVELLARAIDGSPDAEVATATTDGQDGSTRSQPVFSLLQAALLPRLQHDLEQGQRKVDTWMAQQRRVEAHFADAAAFLNINTWSDLERFESTGPNRH